MLLFFFVSYIRYPTLHLCNNQQGYDFRSGNEWPNNLTTV